MLDCILTLDALCSTPIYINSWKILFPYNVWPIRLRYLALRANPEKLSESNSTKELSEETRLLFSYRLAVEPPFISDISTCGMIVAAPSFSK
jgi:hypothetical protein